MARPARKKQRKPPKRRCRTLIDKRTKRRRKVCRKPIRKPGRKTVAKKPVIPPPPVAQPGRPAPSPAALPPTTGLPATDTPPTGEVPGDPEPTTALPRQATFGEREAERLLWRAGFGPRPGEIAAVTALGLEAAVHRLTRPEGDEAFTGAAPVDANGLPYNRQRAVAEYGGDVIWWFDRMVRTTQPLRQRMALVWHDWFATANRQIIGSKRMLLQHDLFAREWLGNFRRLTHDVTVDEAMLVFLNGLDNERSAPNENYARELMELFTLGADRGAYTESDVRELARVLTGYHASWSTEKQDLDGFGFVASRHDAGTKTLWAGTPHARTGTFGWSRPGTTWECDAVDLCLANPFHRSFFVRKLWSYFVPSDPPAATQAALEELYVAGGFAVRPVVEAILMHPALYAAGTRLVKPPVVFCAGLFRARGMTIRHAGLDGMLELAGQRPFDPPDVAGWRDGAWLDTNTLLGRADAVRGVLRGLEVPVDASYPSGETPGEAVDAALGFWGRPTVSPGTREVLLAFAGAAVNDAVLTPAERSRQRAKRQNALRFLVALSPDHQTC